MGRSMAIEIPDHLGLGQLAGRKRPDVRGIARWAAARKKALSPTCDVGRDRGGRGEETIIWFNGNRSNSPKRCRNGCWGDRGGDGMPSPRSHRRP